MGVYLPPFQRLLDEHGAAVLRFVASMVGPDDADDCFQETVIAALTAYPKLRHADNLRAWFFTVARRKAIDDRRARRRRPVPSDRLPETGASGDVEVPDASLWSRVRGLPDRQREALCLRYIADLPYGEIARAMECTPEAARQNVSAALARLRKEMA
jgi:RNA polymerase sigma factor (sigma-70 family)